MQNSMYSTETWITRISKTKSKEMEKGYAAEWRSASHSGV